MANILCDICLSDIPKEFIKTSPTNGKKYLKIVVSERRNADERGNDHAVKIFVPKENRKEGDKPIYIGNGKSSTWGTGSAPASPANQPASGSSAIPDDDLPF